MSSSMRKRVRKLEEEIAFLRERLREAAEDADQRERYWVGRMNRYGAPYIKSVMSRQNGYHLLHPVIHAIPTPDGLDVIIAP